MRGTGPNSEADLAFSIFLLHANTGALLITQVYGRSGSLANFVSALAKGKESHFARAVGSLTGRVLPRRQAQDTKMGTLGPRQRSTGMEAGEIKRTTEEEVGRECV